MGKVEQYDVLVLGSGTGGKVLSWTLRQGRKANCRGRAEVHRRIVPQYSLPA